MFRRLLLLTMVSTAAAVGEARSTTVIPPTFDALVSSAATIFVGEVMNVRSEWETTLNGRAIITLVTFRVEEVWKGDLGAVTQLEFLGGEMGDVGMRVEGSPVFRLGQRDVLFVNSIVRAVSPLVGFMHGRMRVERDTVSGVDRVRTFDGRALGSIAQLGPQRAAPSLASITPMRLNELETAVRSRLGAGKPR